jgi:hypothetical protein
MISTPNSRRLSLLAILASLMVLAVGGCKEKESGSQSSGSSSSTSGGSSGASSGSGAVTTADGISGQGDKEAVQAVCDELAKHWVKTPDGWVSEFPSQVSLATGKRAGPESYYRQIKALKFTLESGEVSESDKLNGVSYRGTGQFDTAPVRLFNDPNAFNQPRWSPWHDSNESVFVEKRNGKWNIAGTAGGWMVAGEKPSAAALAKIK